MSQRSKLFDVANDLHKEDLAIMKAKNTDYAKDVDPFSNFRSSEILGIPAAKGILIRMLDKIARLNSFVDKGTLAVKNESYIDALHDIRNYCSLFAALIQSEEQQATKEKPSNGKKEESPSQWLRGIADTLEAKITNKFPKEGRFGGEGRGTSTGECTWEPGI